MRSSSASRAAVTFASSGRPSSCPESRPCTAGPWGRRACPSRRRAARSTTLRLGDQHWSAAGSAGRGARVPSVRGTCSRSAKTCTCSANAGNSSTMCRATENRMPACAGVGGDAQHVGAPRSLTAAGALRRPYTQADLDEPACQSHRRLPHHRYQQRGRAAVPDCSITRSPKPSPATATTTPAGCGRPGRTTSATADGHTPPNTCGCAVPSTRRRPNS